MQDEAAGSRRRSSWPLRLAAFVVALLLAPWVLGMLTNSDGRSDRVVYWGRWYHTSRVAPDAAVLASVRPLSPVEFAAGSTWMPNPLVVADVAHAPTLLVVRQPSGGFVSYALAGGP